MSTDWEALDDEYRHSKAAAPFRPLPDGTYACVVAAAEVCKNKGNDDFHLYFALEIVEGAHKGRKIWHRRGVTDKTLPWVKADLEAVGFRGKLSETVAGLSSVQGTRLRVRLHTYRGNQSAFLSPLPQAGAAGTKPPSAETGSAGGTEPGESSGSDAPVAPAGSDEDPRPDLTEDHAWWERLLAAMPDDEARAAIHGARCAGCRIVRQEAADETDGGGSGPARYLRIAPGAETVDWPRLRDTWLRPHAAAIATALHQLTAPAAPVAPDVPGQGGDGSCATP